MEDYAFERSISEEALRLGFSFCGFARNESLENLRSFYTDFIRQKDHAGFTYLENFLEKRLNPDLVLKGTRSVIALLMNYYPAEIIPEEDNFIIAKYAYGKDYHRIMRQKMEMMVNFLEKPGIEVKAKSFVDSGAALEKVWAQRCGVGWQGKNTLIINKTAGSFFFIGIIFTNLELIPDASETDHCGDCRRCVEACPTGALNSPYQLDIRKCISYYTIEKKEETPAYLRGKLKDRIFGCDICQDVCPYNRLSKPHAFPGFSPSSELTGMKKNDWLHLTPEIFNRLFSGTAVERTGYLHFMKTIRLI
ncbi:MAG: tRNA epoxyqueuosine(34) reductase QueG [Bacteroidetes bacterium]|nr:tRNA epoxyqueuosine(34) reductase QueG [Bacteroidota bacterium]